MEKFAGQYQLIREENFIEHLLALGIPKEKLPTGLSKEPFGIAVDGKKVSLIYPKMTASLILDEEVEEARPFGSEKNLAKVEGENFIVYTTRGNGTKTRKIYGLSGSELTIRIVDDDRNIPEAKRIFKRL